VTPSLNQAATIEATIRSVLDQGYPELDYQVVDGGSKDGTLAILERFQDRLRWLSEPDRGQAHAVNKGLKAATGDLLAYLNADDTYLPGTLHAVAAAHRARPEVGLLYGDCLAVWEDGTAKGLIRGRPFDLRRMVARGDFVPQQAAFWTRAAMARAGYFDEELHLSLDYDYFIRLGRVAPALYLPQTLACFRFTPTTKSSTQGERHWRETFALSRRHGLRAWHPWFWLRLVRHYGLAALPAPLAGRVRRALNRPQDPALTREDGG
jgi:glycosyltransferase involved in cell wall biosynthesis